MAGSVRSRSRSRSPTRAASPRRSPAKSPAKKRSPTKKSPTKSKSPAKKRSPSKKRRSTSKKAAAAHPTYKEMVKAAIVALKTRGGSSRQAIVKYVTKNFKVGDNANFLSSNLQCLRNTFACRVHD